MRRQAKAAPLQVLFVLLLLTALGSAQDGKPAITKIDPPNWFTRVPDSLLLVRGEHLESTTFTVRNSTARIVETSISPNGHWAFLTFATRTAEPGRLEIVARNRRGSTSASYTLSALSAKPQGFSPADTMYLIMPDRFADGDLGNDRVAGFHAPDDRSAGRAYHGGDLKGIEQHLDYLQQLGVTTLWTTPLYDNSGNQSADSYHGYSATDMYAIDPHFGSMEDYRSLVAAAHGRGMKVVLDTVPNHVGPAHPWASDPPTPDWLHGTPEHHLNVKDDYTSVTDPGAPVARREVFLDGWFADRLPDLNQDNPMVARYLVQNAIWWIESAGLDGLRIDTFAYVPRSFWHGYNEMLHQLYPQLSDVGEIFDGDPHIPSFWAGGRANTGSDGTFDTLLDTPFDFPVYFAIRDVLTHRKAMTALADVLSEDSLYPHPERLVTFLGNHDTKRFLNEKGASPAALRLAFGLIATLRGMPQLYYGEELGMTGGDDPDNRHDFPGGFPNDAVNAFTGANETQAQHEMHDWVQTLLQLRSHTPALQSGSQKTLLADADTFAFVRALPGARDQVLIVLNGDAAAHDVTIPMELLGGDQHYTSLLNGDASVAVTSSTVQVHLPAQQIGIFRAAP